jgi:hypothetical protein
VSAYVFFGSHYRNQTKAIVQAEEDFLIAKIDWTLAGAQTVSLPGASTAGASLMVSRYDGTNVTIAQNGGDVDLGPDILNSAAVTVSNLFFIHRVSSGVHTADSIEAGFTISAKTPDGLTITQTASTTRYLHE